MSQYDVKITGKDLKRFIKNLYKLKINLINITYIDKSIIIRVNKEDYKKVINIKTIYDIEIVNLYGPAKILDFINNYKIFLIYLLIGLLLIWFLSKIVFNINVIHSKKEIRNFIYNELEKYDIKKYKFIKSFNNQEIIVQNILKNNKDTIEWMEIERIGVTYNVKVEERKIKNINNAITPRNIIAKKDGFITNITSSKGTVLITPGTYVKKGDIIISGNIMNKEELKAQVHAEGEVYAETWYQVDVIVPYHYSEEKETGKKQKVLTLSLFNKKINLIDFDKYKNKKLVEKYKISNSILPISLSINEETEINNIDSIYTRELAILKAHEIGENKLKEKLSKNDTILLEKDLKITEENSKINVVMFFKVKENITDFQEIIETKIEG